MCVRIFVFFSAHSCILFFCVAVLKNCQKFSFIACQRALRSLYRAYQKTKQEREPKPKNNTLKLLHRYNLHSVSVPIHISSICM